MDIFLYVPKVEHRDFGREVYPHRANYGVPLPLVNVGVSRLDQLLREEEDHGTAFRPHS